MGRILEKLFGRRKRTVVEDTSEIDVIAQGVRGSSCGVSNVGSSSQYLDGSPGVSVGSTGTHKKFRRQI
jgi:hypothetical protein